MVIIISGRVNGRAVKSIVTNIFVRVLGHFPFPFCYASLLRQLEQSSTTHPICRRSLVPKKVVVNCERMWVKVQELVQEIVRASEKAACIARACRAEKELFALLVEEKKEGEKNPRFVQDFKTLADVLVQETIKHDLGKLFPCLREHIHGEESNKFTNANGDSIIVEIQSTSEATAQVLTQVLEGNHRAAQLLSNTVHFEVQVSVEVSTEAMTDSSSLGIWIDPIDSTSEYIAGNWEMEDEGGVAASGLQCVCILIGVYSLADGVPVMGVINQPFRYQRGSEKYSGQFYWCFSGETVLVSHPCDDSGPSRQRPIVLASTSESPLVLDALRSDCVIKFAAGAGYKLLCVALGLVDAYVLSKATTFRWDTCAPHAYLRAIGGDIVKLWHAVEMHKRGTTRDMDIHYHVAEGGGQWCNSLGLIAYRHLHVLETIVDILSKTST
ncbi:inositol polyphosphate 1-phosphatase-like isoform X2 [Ornithodoros turicata]|uniref:inositol polyphosphate 1-phosphatase-like isoform X2 n=1 Tax=Ornithodoros turicata TaxID=34597 RepID=UPI003139A622